MTDPVFRYGEALLNCLSAAVTGMANAPSNVCFRVGPEIVHDLDQFRDLCCEGLAYVSLMDTWPSANSFPEQDFVRQANTVCAPPAWAQQFRVGIVRCIPVMTDNFGGMPTCSDWEDAYIRAVADSIALRQVACCFRNYVMGREDDLLGMSIVIERQTQSAPLGGCIERYFTVSVQFPNCDLCITAV